MKKKTGGAAPSVPRDGLQWVLRLSKNQAHEAPVPRNGRAVPKNTARLRGAGPLFRRARPLPHGTHHPFPGTAAHSTERLARFTERNARSRERKAQISAPKFAPRRLSRGPGLAQVTKKRGRSGLLSTTLAVRHGRGRGRQRRGAGGKRATAGQKLGPGPNLRPILVTRACLGGDFPGAADRTGRSARCSLTEFTMPTHHLRAYRAMCGKPRC